MTEWNKRIKLCKFLRLRNISILLPFLLLFCSWNVIKTLRPCQNFSRISSVDLIVRVWIFSSLFRMWPGSSSFEGSDSVGELPLKCSLWMDHSCPTWVYHPAEVRCRIQKWWAYEKLGWDGGVLCLGDQGWDIGTILLPVILPPGSSSPYPFRGWNDPIAHITSGNIVLL